MKRMFIKAVLIALVMAMLPSIAQFDIGAMAVSAATENTPTIQMGENAPMTRDAFLAWAHQQGIRHINYDGRMYPVGIFFNWANGMAFDYGTLTNGVVEVFLRGMEIESTAEAEQSLHYYEATVATEAIIPQNPLDTISAITLPNRRLTAGELDAWIYEYHAMGGASAFELAVVEEINRVRALYGLRNLTLDPTLMMSARMKTHEFADLQYFAHTSPIHGSVTEAARMFGFDGWFVSESITRTGSSSAPTFTATPEGIVQGMLESTRGHRELLLNPDISTVGFGAFFSPNSTGLSGRMSHMFYFATKFGFPY
ncbi:MAG: CAP domain-containing protein [Defluviitaleaceae bacterium]|nr:CAP domain-containing protein [Defluviitaleaceae bacterium]MCL2274217.1 CAP domain-containing protein [Defluviitaleaceae bacterium]